MMGNIVEIQCWTMREYDHVVDVRHYIIYLYPLSHLVLKMTMQVTYCFVCCAKKLKHGPKNLNKEPGFEGNFSGLKKSHFSHFLSSDQTT